MDEWDWQLWTILIIGYWLEVKISWSVGFSVNVSFDLMSWVLTDDIDKEFCNCSKLTPNCLFDVTHNGISKLTHNVLRLLLWNLQSCVLCRLRSDFTGHANLIFMEIFFGIQVWSVSPTCGYRFIEIIESMVWCLDWRHRPFFELSTFSLHRMYRLVNYHLEKCMVISNCELLRAMYILRRPLLMKNEDCFMSWILFWRWCWILLFVLWKFYIHSKSCTILEVVLDTDFEGWKSFGGGVCWIQNLKRWKAIGAFQRMVCT